MRKIHPQPPNRPLRKGNNTANEPPIRSNTTTVKGKQICSKTGSIVSAAISANDKDNKENVVGDERVFLSRDTIGSDSRGSLRDSQQLRDMVYTQNSKETTRNYDPESFDRRFSLKFAGNYPQSESVQSQRLSMLPIRPQTYQPRCLVDERESVSVYQKSTSGYEGRSQQLKRETIISNLVDKLDREQDLRSIIESKLRMNTSQFKERSTTFIEEDSALTKLKQCENQIKYFKATVQQMAEKIEQLQQRNFSKSNVKERYFEESAMPVGVESTLLALLGKMGKQCAKCECGKMKKGVEIGVQTMEVVEAKSQPSQMEESCDFFSNLEHTLQVLQTRQH